METKKEKKKGFWSTLFAPKKKSCCCDSDLVLEDEGNAPRSCECGSETSGASENSCCASAPDIKVKEVLVLGPGCAKCKSTYNVVERVISESGLDIKLSKIEDIAEMMKFNIMTTPAVVIDGCVRIKGHVPSADEVKKAIGI